MTQVRHYNLSTGHIEIIRQWMFDTSAEEVQGFVNSLWEQDHCADSYYDAIVVEDQHWSCDEVC